MSRFLNFAKLKLFFIPIIYASLILVGGCSTGQLSQHVVIDGPIEFRGGVFREKRWEEQITFQKISWYKDALMLFQVLIADLPKESPFFNWMSNDEKERLLSCDNYFLSITYAFDPRRINLSHYVRELSHQGYGELIFPHFVENIKLHPDFEKQFLTRHKVQFFCAHGEFANEIKIALPGFNSEKIYPISY